jgi:hypothetical protein
MRRQKARRAAAFLAGASLIANVQVGSAATPTSAAHPSGTAAAETSATGNSPSHSDTQVPGTTAAIGGSTEKTPAGNGGSLMPCSSAPPYTSLPCLPVKR